MRKLIHVFSCILVAVSSFSQVQWADEIGGFSTSYIDQSNSYAYQPIQAVGSPTTDPKFNISTVTAWSPSNENAGLEFIELKFSTPTKICQVIINESLNAGTITSIELIAADKSTVMTLSEPLGFKTETPGSLLIKLFDLTDVPVASVKITMDTKLVSGYNHIDAVGISASKTPYVLAVNSVNYNGETYTKEQLSSKVNSTTDELLPVISPDGKTIYFVREKHPNNMKTETQDIWYSTFDENGLPTEAILLPAPINNVDNNAVCSVTPDGQKLLLLNSYLPDGTMDKGVSIALKEGDNWGFPVPLKITDYYNNNIYGEYCLLNDGKTMVLTTQRNEGWGSKDVQVCFLQEDNTWSTPKNLGPTINTAASEGSPFMAADGKTLYFASRGHLGYGSNDVFMSTRLDDSWTNWSEPINLGPSINSVGWDAYYTIPAKGDYAYFINYTDTSGGDIFRIKLPNSAKPSPVSLIKGRVFDAETKLPLESEISYESLVSGKEVGIANSNKTDGKFSIVLPGGDYYGFLANAKNYYPISQNLDLRKLAEFQEKEIDLYLQPIKVGQKVKLNNVFFDTGKFSFRKETYSELDRLVLFLKANVGIVIRIDGHTDDQGEDASNKILSNNRAKSVYDYLISKGIPAIQISFKGFGETMPVDKNTTETGRQNNRRVEFLIEKL